MLDRFILNWGSPCASGSCSSPHNQGVPIGKITDMAARPVVPLIVPPRPVVTRPYDTALGYEATGNYFMKQSTSSPTQRPTPEAPPGGTVIDMGLTWQVCGARQQPNPFPGFPAMPIWGCETVSKFM